jgi:hypothetical protein
LICDKRETQKGVKEPHRLGLYSVWSETSDRFPREGASNRTAEQMHGNITVSRKNKMCKGM